VINTGVISFGTGAFFFLVLSLVLLTGQQGRARKNALKFAAIASTVWLGFAAFAAYNDIAFLAYLIEPLRGFAWLLFLGYVMLSAVTGKQLASRRFRKAVAMASAVTLMLIMMVVFRIYAGPDALTFFGIDLLYAGFLLMAVASLVLVEQVMRNAHIESRRAIKYLCIGLGIIFVYDFYLYSTALLFHALDPELWQVRGFVNAMAVAWSFIRRHCSVPAYICWQRVWVVTTSRPLVASGVRLSRSYSCLAPAWCFSSCCSPAGCVPA
jgi:hypothetical protein